MTTEDFVHLKIEELIKEGHISLQYDSYFLEILEAVLPSYFYKYNLKVTIADKVMTIIKLEFLTYDEYRKRKVIRTQTVGKSKKPRRISLETDVYPYKWPS